MKKIIVKNELEALRYDVSRGMLVGQDPEELLNMVMTKIGFIFKSRKKSYFTIVWEE